MCVCVCVCVCVSVGVKEEGEQRLRQGKRDMNEMCVCEQ